AGLERVASAAAVEAADPLRAGGVARRDAGAQARHDEPVEAGSEAANVVGDRPGAGVGADRAQAAETAAPSAPQRRRGRIAGDLAGLGQRDAIAAGGLPAS